MAAEPILEHNIHQTMDWIYAIEEACHWDEDNQKKAFAALRAVLHELRDLLPLEYAAQLSCGLPLFIRGLFYENWHPRFIPPQEIKREDFLESIAQTLYPYSDLDLEDTIRGVLQVLGEKLPPGEMEKILMQVPIDVQDLYKKGNTMPYETIADLPKAIKNTLPTHAQEIYRAAFNNAWEEYKDSHKRMKNVSHEETAHRVAWAAVKKKYVKKGETWKAK